METCVRVEEKLLLAQSGLVAPVQSTLVIYIYLGIVSGNLPHYYNIKHISHIRIKRVSRAFHWYTGKLRSRKAEGSFTKRFPKPSVSQNSQPG